VGGAGDKSDAGFVIFDFSGYAYDHASMFPDGYGRRCTQIHADGGRSCGLAWAASGDFGLGFGV
jgi:hypothetical protein